MKLLAYFIENFKNNTPQSPIKALHILKPSSKIRIDCIQNENDDLVHAILKIDDDEIIGKGKSKRHAKEVAYKLAVRKYDVLKQIVFF